MRPRLDSQQDQQASVQGTVVGNLVEICQALGGGWEVRQNAPIGDLIPAEIQEEMRARTHH